MTSIQDTPQNVDDGGLMLSESSTLMFSPLERRRLEYGKDAIEDEDEELIRQREKEEMLYSLYEPHNIPASLPPKVTPAKKMVHMIDQALNTHDTFSGNRRSKYSKSMPDLNFGSSVGRFIGALNPYGETTRSKSCSNVTACEYQEDEGADIAVSNSLSQHTLSSIKNSLHVSPSFHVKQQQRARWIPGVTYLPLLVVQYVWHPFYAIWKSLTTEEYDSTVKESSFYVAEDNHHGHHHKHHHHHHHHHRNNEEESKTFVDRDGHPEARNLTTFISAPAMSPSYVHGGDLFVE